MMTISSNAAENKEKYGLIWLLHLKVFIGGHRDGTFCEHHRGVRG
jgi:hypothetical protein